ncbi:exopolysaccharide biosynthesis predicted pyruvyl transferase EpsI [Weissella uvarum]|uniref:polysaccharide pyruvyl transferase family protein n=1 Tax=Weissella uvarum TaxID=1479233 RepID=UPI001961F761|nr:polysaccharide pyruvyl transferase family protein [Weissella uvarum]MBM7617966.1 exopolysaccharide biosynthesis predicted pyruvyl transferase EpsI [Weissella uvarum]MCM0596185.1 polysaccharide pyruvyl transferase family protein [Weissella uvarum]
MISKYFKPSNYYRRVQEIGLNSQKKHFNLKPSSKPRVYLFDVPTHNNLGDQAITYAELDFISKELPDYEVVKIFEGMQKSAINAVKEEINSDDIIAINGGGNMGDVWLDYEIDREQIVEAFGNVENRMISFPQSYNFTATSEGNQRKEIANKIYSGAHNLYMLARETLSQKKMQDNFNLKHGVELVPDIVMSLDKRRTDINRNQILTVLRSDKEVVQNNEKDALIGYLQEHILNIKQSDTVINYNVHILSDKMRARLLNEKWAEFSSAKLVITDRLHGMIFAYITGTPAIVFDNSNHKVKASYQDWLQDTEYIYLADDYSFEELVGILKHYSQLENYMGEPAPKIDEQSYLGLKKALLGEV